MPKGVYKKTKEQRKKMSEAHKGKKRPPFSKEWREKMSKGQTGKKLSQGTKNKIGLAQKGEKSHLWKDGRTNNKSYISWLKNRRNRMKLIATGSHTFGEWELLRKQYGYVCLCCGLKEPDISLTEDHIIPISKGGSDYIENIQPLCKSCNSKKYNKIKKYGLE